MAAGDLIGPRSRDLTSGRFAPGAETVKGTSDPYRDQRVGRYFPQGQMVEEEDDHSRPLVTVGVCGNCQHVRDGKNLRRALSDVRVPHAGVGDGDREYRCWIFPAQGFTSYYTGGADTTGPFEFFFFLPCPGRKSEGRAAQLPLILISFRGRHGGEEGLYVINDKAAGSTMIFFF